MNLILCIVFLVYFCLLQVYCRSLQVAEDVREELEIRDDVNRHLENGGKFSWKRLKPILRREVQRIRNVKDMEASRFNKKSAVLTFLNPSKDEDVNKKYQGADKIEDSSFKAGPQMRNTSSMESKLPEKNKSEELISQSDLPEEIEDNSTPVGILKTDSPLTMYDFPDNVLSNILNQSGDSIVLQALNDNSSKSLEFDETTLLSGGGQVATLQQASTIGFELLIDSETKQNLILTELLASQSSLVDDNDFTEFTHEKDSSIFTFSTSNENELEQTTTIEDAWSSSDTDGFSINETENETTESDFVDSFKDINITEHSTNEEASSNFSIAEFSTVEIGNERTELDPGDSVHDNVTEFSTNKEASSNFGIAEFNTLEIEIEKTELNLGDSFKDNVTEIPTNEKELEYSKVELSTVEIENETNELDLGDSFQYNVTEFSPLEKTSSNLDVAEFSTVEIKTEKTGSDLGDSFQDNVTEVSTNKETLNSSDTAVFSTVEIENENTELDFTNSFQGNVTGISNTTPSDPRCPDPGWCVFWFLSQEDTCAKDSHCHGSLICCMWGCSKACVDPDSELW